MRDLLLGRRVRDLDLVVTGDATRFARALAARLGATVRAHDRFSTATLTLPTGEIVDIAAARTERYAAPGALPTVASGATIAEDLARRDFSIHALALELGGGRRLVDPLGGATDLARRLVRTLHPRSFRDDPTRGFRAVRYAHRLGFRLAPATRRELAAALRGGALDTISGDRLRRELRLLFGEPDRAGALARLEAAGIDGAIDPALRRRPGARGRLRRLERKTARPAPASWETYLLAWLGPSSDAEAASTAARLSLAGGEARTVRGWPAVLATLAAAAKGPVAALRRALRDAGPDAAVAAEASLPPREARAIRALRGSPEPRLSIRGADLRAAGVPSGPAIGRALARTLAALEEGRVDRSGELAFALRAARGGAGP